MGFHDPFRYSKHKLWPKEGPWVKLSIWFLTIKSWEWPWFSYVQMVCHIPLERSQQGLQFCFKFTSIRGLHTKLWDSKVARVPILGISGLPFGSLGTQWHLGASPMASHREYYKGEGGGFPQIQAMVSLMRPCLHVAHLCTKNASTTY